MSVIVTGMDMPENCFECSTKVDPETRRCNIDGLLFEETIELCTSKRHPDCPLKSVEGLIDEIEQLYLDDGAIQEYSKDEIVDLIERYCEVSTEI